MGSYATAAQFQQRPAPRGGGMFKVDAMPVVDDWPRDAALARAWDFAATEARALDLGAKPASDVHGTKEPWRTYTDPAGHPFCLVTA